MGLIKIGFKLNSKDAKAQKSLEKIFMSESIILQKTEDKKQKKTFSRSKRLLNKRREKLLRFIVRHLLKAVKIRSVLS